MKENLTDCALKEGVERPNCFVSENGGGGFVLQI
jgi:hypothetical protein